MKEQIALQNLLRGKLSDIQRSNPQYSLRAFSKKVGVHVGALSSILNGKRNVSRDLAERISQRLLLDPQERSEILGLFPVKRLYKKPGTSKDVPSFRYLELTASQFKISTEWEHFAVMSLLNCEDFQESPEWVSRRLGINESKAKQVIERLVQLELFTRDDSGKLTRSQKSFRTTDDIADVSLKRHHEQSLDLAKESLHRDSVTIRDFTTLTMAIDPSKLSTAKELIRKQQDELSDLLESGTRTEVYRLSVQLFPLSKLGEEK
ncbi:MAG: TIGR02147 family protein [Xanthomonadaceae bacterium]|nr:TIGR02147 family protein [Xanthomonadaceae bacterium]